MKTISFSIKWKAVIFLSAILLCTCTFMVGLYTYTLLQQANERATSINQQDDKTIKDLLTNFHLNLQQLAVIIPHLSNVQSSLQDKNQINLIDALQEHWQNLSLNLDIQSLHLFDAEGQHQGGYYADQTAQQLNHVTVRREVLSVIQQQQPSHMLQCDSQCSLFAFEPYLLNDGTRGVIVISQSIATLVTRFQQLTGRDLAILKSGMSHTDNRDLLNWQMSIWALSQFDTLSPLLYLSQQQAMTPGDGILKSVDNQPFRLHRISHGPLPRQDNQPVFISISEISQETQDLSKAIYQGVASGIGGLVLSELLLLLLIWKPTQRLQQLARALPLLSRQEYVSARQKLPPPEHSLLQDELDLLEQTTLTVAEQLEQMQNQVNQHARQLEKQMAEQIRARHFTTQLLDTAPLIIVTQCPDAQILSMNQWGQNLTHWSSDPTSRHAVSSFMSLHAEGSLPNDFQDNLQALKEGLLPTFQHEAQLFETNGTLHYITWLHSRVEDMNGNRSILSVGMDLTDRIEAENKLSWLASHDTLTGLMNRRSFQAQLKKSIERGGSGALLFIDVDRFKSVNDTVGHGVGDQVLKRIARILQGQTRDTDFIARLGGDEFTIILPRANKHEAERVMAKLSTQLNTQISLSNGAKQHFSCSIGGALFPKHGNNDEELLACADMAMYNAKQSGQGRWHLYTATEAIFDRIHADVSWQSTIREAFRDNLFRLYFQPILNIEAGSICHYEVLLRIQLADGKIILPGEFIPVAERTGMIWQIDEWVLTESMRLLQTHNRQHPQQPITLAINVSAPTLQSPEFIGLFMRLCEQYQVAHHQLIIEITETAFLDDFNSAQRTLQILVNQGCAIALDDFGVGFSSFSYLKQMPLSYVKLDGSYIRAINTNPQEQTFVRCLTEMVAGFDMVTIAEFVETPEVLRTIKSLGVTCAQGYLIGKPSPTIEDQATIGRRMAEAPLLEEV